MANNSSSGGSVQGTPDPLSSLEELVCWFNERGGTDESYLRAHFSRFKASYDFAAANLDAQSIVLDVGAHWLHQATFFARAGHKLICAEVAGGPPDLPNVQEQARALGANLVLIKRLELGHGLESIEDGTVDAIVFSEILEHIAFNPIPMWKTFYAKLRDSGKIYISTPNSCYFRSVHRQLLGMGNSGCFGINTDDVFDIGTYGHHWKEYSIEEIRHYFSRMSTDFVVSRIETTSYRDHSEELEDFERLAASACIPHVDFRSVIDGMDRRGLSPFGKQIFIEVSLQKSSVGISINPPWIPV